MSVICIYIHMYTYIYIYVISSRFRTSSQPPCHGFCGVQRWSYNDSDGGKHAIPKYFSQGRCHVPFAWTTMGVVTGTSPYSTFQVVTCRENVPKKANHWPEQGWRLLKCTPACQWKPTEPTSMLRCCISKGRPWFHPPKIHSCSLPVNLSSTYIYIQYMEFGQLLVPKQFNRTNTILNKKRSDVVAIQKNQRKQIGNLFCQPVFFYDF